MILTKLVDAHEATPGGREMSCVEPPLRANSPRNELSQIFTVIFKAQPSPLPALLMAGSWRRRRGVIPGRLVAIRPSTREHERRCLSLPTTSA